MSRASYRKEQSDSRLILRWVPILIVLAIAAVLVWEFLIKPFAEWIKLHALVVSIGALVLGILIILACYFFWRLAREKDELRSVLESKGYSEYKDYYGTSKWGTEREIADWKKEDKLFCDILEVIRIFTPSKVWEREEPYHLELQGCLRTRFRQSRIEVQTASSRPDIVIDHIAIEVKGPTYDGDLETIPEKCEKYLKHWKRLILVFFEPRYSDEKWNELIRPLPKQYKHSVELIRKESMSEVEDG